MPGVVTSGTRPSREMRRVMLGIMMGLALASLDGTTVATALPTIVADLGGLDRLPWVVAAYMTATTVVLPLYGRWSDILGRRAMFLAAIAVFVAGAVFSSLSHTMTQLIWARALQGAGAGGLVVLAQAIVADVVPARQRSRYLGYIGGLMAVGSITGPLVGGVLAEHAGWRWIFLMAVPVGLTALAMTARHIPKRAVVADRNFDPMGALLLGVLMTTLVFVVLWGGYIYPWSDPVIIALIGLLVVGLTALVLVERRVADGILPFGILGRKDVILANVVALLTGATIFGLIVFTPLFLQVAVSASPTASGLLLLPLMVGFMASSIGTGRLITHIGRYKIFPVVGSALLTISFLLLSTMTPDVPYGAVALYLVVGGVGVGMVMQVIVLALQISVPDRYLGAATSSAQFFRSIGGTVGIAAFGTVLNTRLISELSSRPGLGAGGLGIEPRRLIEEPSLVAGLPPGAQAAVAESLAGAVSFVFLLSAPLSLAAFLVALWLREHPLREAEGEGALGDGVIGHV